MKNSLLLFCLFSSFIGFGQLKEFAFLPESLNEISGLEQLNDSTFVAINDGGDKANLYLINLKGEIIKTVRVYNAKNKDWEDLTRDKKNLYIADLGNNENSRGNLKIYKVKIEDLLSADSVKAKKITVEYTDQKKTPATKKNKNFDVEAIAYKNDSIWIFTKCNTQPWTGQTKIYKVPKKAGKYKISPKSSIYIGPNGWFSDAVTSADIHKGKLYLITYTHLYIYEIKPSEFKLINQVNLGNYTQKESVLYINSNLILIADEVQKLIGGGKLYQLKLK